MEDSLKHSGYVMAAVAGAIFVTSCSVPPGVNAGHTVSWVQYRSSVDEGDMAGIGGTIVVKDGCLAIDEGAGEAVLLAFRTDDPRPHDLDEGDPFEGSGGLVPFDASDPDHGIPESCSNDSEIWIVNGPWAEAP